MKKQQKNTRIASCLPCRCSVFAWQKRKKNGNFAIMVLSHRACRFCIWCYRLVLVGIISYKFLIYLYQCSVGSDTHTHIYNIESIFIVVRVQKLKRRTIQIEQDTFLSRKYLCRLSDRKINYITLFNVSLNWVYECKENKTI